MAQQNRRPNLVIEGAEMIWRNLGGRPSQFNAAGNRNFCLLLDDETAAAMKADGWNVRDRVDTYDPNAPVEHILKVTAKYHTRDGRDMRPPTVYMVSSRGRTPLGEDMIELLDFVDIKNVDLIVRPYEYDMNGRKGISAQLQALYVTIQEDKLALKYADIPEIDFNGASLALTTGEEVDDPDVIDGEAWFEDEQPAIGAGK